MPQLRIINTLLAKIENEKAMLGFRWAGIVIALIGAIIAIVGYGIADISPYTGGIIVSVGSAIGALSSNIISNWLHYRLDVKALLEAQPLDTQQQVEAKQRLNALYPELAQKLKRHTIGRAIVNIVAIGVIVGLGMASPFLAGFLGKSQWIAALVQAFIPAVLFAAMGINSLHRFFLIRPYQNQLTHLATGLVNNTNQQLRDTTRQLNVTQRHCRDMLEALTPLSAQTLNSFQAQDYVRMANWLKARLTPALMTDTLLPRLRNDRLLEFAMTNLYRINTDAALQMDENKLNVFMHVQFREWCEKNDLIEAVQPVVNAIILANRPIRAANLNEPFIPEALTIGVINPYHAICLSPIQVSGLNPRSNTYQLLREKRLITTANSYINLPDDTIQHINTLSREMVDLLVGPYRFTTQRFRDLNSFQIEALISPKTAELMAGNSGPQIFERMEQIRTQQALDTYLNDVARDNENWSAEGTNPPSARC